MSTRPVINQSSNLRGDEITQEIAVGTAYCQADAAILNFLIDNLNIEERRFVLEVSGLDDIRHSSSDLCQQFARQIAQLVSETRRGD